MITVGVLGAGQLGRMLALAGIPLDMRFRFLDPAAAPPAAGLGEHLRAEWDDPKALAALADGTDVITYEFENVPVETVRWLMERVPVRPGVEALRIGRDRLAEKRFLSGLGIAVAPFAEVHDRASLDAALRQLGVPALLKTRVGGYDGRGQAAIDAPARADAAWLAIGEQPAVLERRVAFRRELAIVAVRGGDGTLLRYPLVETRHVGGILATAVAPAPDVTEALARDAELIATRVLEALEHVGVLTIECFELDGRLVVNEFAPRVHNSGHWTIEGAATSQFENHLRAIANLPLGSTEPHGLSGLVNLIGGTPPREAVLAHPDTYLHLYGKAARPGRKVGHVTLLARDRSALAARLRDLTTLIGSQPSPAERSLP